MAGKGKYEKQVRPFLAGVTERIAAGWTEKSVAAELGVSHSAWADYKKKHKALAEAVDKGRVNFGFEAVRVARQGLLKRAEGFTVPVQKKYKKIDKETNHLTEYVEEHEQYYPPDVQACHLLLKNLDRGEGEGRPAWESDPASSDIRKRELALKERLAASQDWLAGGGGDGDA